MFASNDFDASAPPPPPQPTNSRLIGAVILIIAVVLVLAFSMYIDSTVFIPFGPTYALTLTADAKATPIPRRPTLAPSPRGPRRTIAPTPMPGEQASHQDSQVD